MSYWVYVPSWGVAVAAPPKCGSRSVLITIVKHFYPGEEYQTVRPSVFREYHEHYQYMDKSQVNPAWTKLAIMRDPVERFASLWAHHCRDGVPGIPRELRDGASMEALLLHIKSNLHANPHWIPQTDIIGTHKNIQYCLLEDAANIWAGMLPNAPLLEHVNKTLKPVTLPGDIEAEIKTIYDQDYQALC